MTNQFKERKTTYSRKVITTMQLKVMIDHFREIDEKNDFQVLLMTPYGFIKGDLENFASKDEFISTNTENPLNLKIDMSFLMKQTTDFLSELKNEIDDLKIIDNCGALNIRNAEILKDDFNNPIATLDQLIVFADHILGFSLVPRYFR